MPASGHGHHDSGLSLLPGPLRSGGDPKDQNAIGEDINDIVSVDASLLGVVMKEIEFGVMNVVTVDDRSGVARAGAMLHSLPAVERRAQE